MKARWRAVGIVLVLAALLASIGTANAARLPLSGATLTTLPVFTRCTNEVQVEPGAVRQNGTSKSVVVRGLTPRCAGARVKLTIVEASGAVLLRVEGRVPATGPATVTLGATKFTPAQDFRVFATVGTWGVPATWTSVPPTPVLTCEVWRDNSNATPRPKADELVKEVNCSLGAPAVETWGHPVVNYVGVSVQASLSRDLNNDEYATFSFTVPSDLLPGTWSWADANIASSSFWAGGSGPITSKCSELPVIRGRTPTNYGRVGSLYLQITQGGSQGICQPG